MQRQGFRGSAPEQYKESKCPLCGITHTGNVKSRKVPGTDGVVCKACKPLRIRKRKPSWVRQKFLREQRALEDQRAHGVRVLDLNGYQPGAFKEREYELTRHRVDLGLDDKENL